MRPTSVRPATARVSARVRLTADLNGQREFFCLDAQAKFLSELDEKIRPLNDDEEILWTTVQAVGEHLGVARCMISEVDHDGGTAVIHRDYCSGVPSIAGSRSLSSFGTTESMAEMHSGQVFSIADAAADP